MNEYMCVCVCVCVCVCEKRNAAGAMCVYARVCVHVCVHQSVQHPLCSFSVSIPQGSDFGEFLGHWERACFFPKRTRSCPHCLHQIYVYAAHFSSAFTSNAFSSKCTSSQTGNIEMESQASTPSNHDLCFSF